MLALGGGEGFQLLGRGISLMLLFPLGKWHAVDGFARLLLGHGPALRFGRFAVPIAQAVAAEAGENHQVDVLHVGAFLVEMLQQTAKCCRFDRSSARIGA